MKLVVVREDYFEKPRGDPTAILETPNPPWQFILSTESQVRPVRSKTDRKKEFKTQQEIMSSKEAPYATMHDLPTYQEREKVGSAPWEKDQRPAPSSRGPHFEPCFYPSSQTAPFATNDNLPIPRQVQVLTLLPRP